MQTNAGICLSLNFKSVDYLDCNLSLKLKSALLSLLAPKEDVKGIQNQALNWRFHIYITISSYLHVCLFISKLVLLSITLQLSTLQCSIKLKAQDVSSTWCHSWDLLIKTICFSMTRVRRRSGDSNTYQNFIYN